MIYFGKTAKNVDLPVFAANKQCERSAIKF